MLGGSFWIALLRNAISTGLMLSFFFMLDRPRFSMKKTAWCYIIFGVSMVTAYSVWYLAANSSFVRFAALSALPAIGVFCSIMSSEVLYLSLYKMALTFYLFSVCTFCGVDVARWWFGGNLWIDILVRFFCFVLILIFTWFKFRKQFLGGVDFLLQEMDLFSAAALFVSVMLGAIMAYWPNLQGFSIFNMVRAFLILFMAGTLQYVILHLYIHLGQEHYYQAEKELLEVNEQLLHQQMDLMRESEIEAARIRHDVRHHTLLIREYVQKREYGQLLAYLTQYDEDVEKWKVKDVSRNLAVNSILLAYAKTARRQNIQVNMDVRLGENLPIRDIDWVAILANMFENAIHGCAGSRQPQQEIDIYISPESVKLVVLRKGLPQSDKGGGMGVASIMKAVSRYEGETDFSVQDGMFITRILLNLT